MSSISSSIQQHPVFARPLTRRVRPPDVAAELLKLEGMASPVILRRVREPDKSQQLSKEALVSIFRAYIVSGDAQSANEVFLAIVARISGSIANKLVRWNSLAHEQSEDVRQSVIIGLYEYLSSQEPTEELWECNFKTSFDMRILNIIGKLTRASSNTVSMTAADDPDESSGQYDIEDPAAESSFSSIEVREAIAFLDGIDPRIGKSFYLKFFGEISEREIAELMEVSERTVRNWITTARIRLRQYFAEA